jgi:uncharacterized protein (DUF169 family)
MEALELTAERVRELGAKLRDLLELRGEPVGVRLLRAGAERPVEAKALEQHRYCQAVMRARHGEDVLLDASGISCPAAAAVFGFHPLPAGLASGQGLVGFGIVADPEVGRRIFEQMPKLELGTLEALHVFPLSAARHVPDVIVVEDAVETLMWIVLAYMHATGGQRVESSTAVLQAVCADSTLIPFLEHRLNFGYGCYGCRDATDIERNETVLGMPGDMLPAVVEHLAVLREKAMPASRSKRTLAGLEARARRRSTSP